MREAGAGKEIIGIIIRVFSHTNGKGQSDSHKSRIIFFDDHSHPHPDVRIKLRKMKQT